MADANSAAVRPEVMGQLNLDLFANGMFRRQLINPLGVTGVEGQWQANPIQNQIALQGMQSNGFQVIPLRGPGADRRF
jgi:hypothetical protein